MLDKKVQEFLLHQKFKRLVKLNTMGYRCLLFCENNFLPALIKFIKKKNNRKFLKVVARKSVSGLPPAQYFIIPVALVSGFNINGDNITIIIREPQAGANENLDQQVEEEDEAENEEEDEVEYVQEPIILKFSSNEILRAAFSAITAFVSDVEDVLTPAASSSSGSFPDPEEKINQQHEEENNE